MAATMLTGCAGQNANHGTAGENSTPQTEKKEKVVVACWGNQMLDSYTQYLCDLFPEVEFEFVLATNSTDYYRFRADHDDMPDILTVRRFALKDAVLLMPYFGQTEKDNWYLTYPAFQIAASKKGMDDPEREKLILDILTAMVSQDGQEHITAGKNMVPYNKDITLELLPELDNLKPYIEENKLYIRLASNDMFRISRDVVQMILNGEVQTAQEALTAFNNELAGEEPGTQIVAHIHTPYANEFTPEHGNQAASAVANTMRKLSGCDLVLLQGCYVASDIYAGDYFQKDLGYLAYNSGNPGLMELTGEQVYAFVETNLSLTDGRGAVCNDSTLYVSSGFEMDITKTDSGYTLNALTIDGKEMDRNKTYSFIAYGDVNWYLNLVTEKLGISEVDTTGPRMPEYMTQRLVEEGGQLEAPTDYIILR